MKFVVRESVECDEATFWEVFASPEYIEATSEASGSQAEVTAQDGAPPGEFTRTVRLTSPVDAPGPVKKLIGETQTVVDDGRYDPAAGTWTYTITPDTLADKIRISGVISLEGGADGSVVKANQVEVSVKIFGIGGLVEKSVESQTRKKEKLIAAAMNRLLSDR